MKNHKLLMMAILLLTLKSTAFAAKGLFPVPRSDGSMSWGSARVFMVPISERQLQMAPLDVQLSFIDDRGEVRVSEKKVDRATGILLHSKSIASRLLFNLYKPVAKEEDHVSVKNYLDYIHGVRTNLIRQKHSKGLTLLKDLMAYIVTLDLFKDFPRKQEGKSDEKKAAPDG